MLIFDLKIFIPFVNGVKLPKILPGIKFQLFLKYSLYFCETEGRVWQGWNFRSFATKKSKIASLSVQWWSRSWSSWSSSWSWRSWSSSWSWRSWSWSSWSWSWWWRSWSSSWSWWSWSSAKLRERLAHNADGRQFSGFTSENLREAQNNQIQPDNSKKVSKTQNNQIQTRQLVRGGGEIWDMSKKFTFDSRCYRRKNKSLSGILYTWKRVQPWYHSLALVWNRRIETSQIIHTRWQNLCNQIQIHQIYLKLQTQSHFCQNQPWKGTNIWLLKIPFWQTTIKSFAWKSLQAAFFTFTGFYSQCLKRE